MLMLMKRLTSGERLTLNKLVLLHMCLHAHAHTHSSHPTHTHTQSSSGMSVNRKSGSMASMSGGDDMMYLEVKKNKPKEQHPLFKMRR